jgi:hypothetical protein
MRREAAILHARESGDARPCTRSRSRTWVLA